MYMWSPRSEWGAARVIPRDGSCGPRARVRRARRTVHGVRRRRTAGARRVCAAYVRAAERVADFDIAVAAGRRPSGPVRRTAGAARERDRLISCALIHYYYITPDQIVFMVSSTTVRLTSRRARAAATPDMRQPARRHGGGCVARWRPDTATATGPTMHAAKLLSAHSTAP